MSSWFCARAIGCADLGDPRAGDARHGVVHAARDPGIVLTSVRKPVAVSGLTIIERPIEKTS